jgi:hypothetical protein
MGRHRGRQVDHAVGLQLIDPYRSQATALATSAHERSQRAPRPAAASRRRKVLEVDNPSVGSAREHVLVCACVGAGAEQPRPAQIWVEGGHLSAAPEVFATPFMPNVARPVHADARCRTVLRLDILRPFERRCPALAHG